MNECNRTNNHFTGNSDTNNLTLFERRIRPLFLYVGFFASIIFTIAYIMVVTVMITGLGGDNGFAPTIDVYIGFLIAQLIAGFFISLSMMIQGQDFAKDKPDNKEVMSHWVKKKEVKLHSMSWYWFWAIMKLLFTRLIAVIAMTYIVIDICYKGTQQYGYFLTAIFNVLMFIAFGMLGCVQMFDKYDKRYIPFVRRKLDENTNKVEKDYQYTDNNSPEVDKQKSI